jgi:BASS family bile acid:Na+ symporter
MDLLSLIRTAILLSMVLLVVALGMRASPGDLTYLLSRPRLLIRSLLAMSVFVPLFAVLLIVLFDLHPAVEIALISLALSPVPPFLPDQQLKLGNDRGYVYALFVSTALFSAITIPISTSFLFRHSAATAHIGAGKVLSLVSITVLFPLLAGVILRRLFPGAGRWSTPLSRVATVLLIVAVLPVLFSDWRAMVDLVGNGTVLTFAALSIAGVIIGHLMGGSDPDDRSVLALACASRHPAVALAIASASFPKERLVPAAVVLALLVGTIASAPYSAWRKRLHALHAQ